MTKQEKQPSEARALLVPECMGREVLLGMGRTSVTLDSLNQQLRQVTGAIPLRQEAQRGIVQKYQTIIARIR